MRIELAGEISISMNDASVAKELTMSVPWVESGDGDVAVFGYDEFLPENTYISAVFSPGSAKIYTTDTLDTLRQYLTVTQHYSNGETETVIDYTLSGTLTPGTSVIIVSYLGQTASFEVTVQSLVIVPWSTGTDEQIANMITALDNGDITIADTGWQIGDERVVSLSAMEASGVMAAHAAQSVTLVLMDSQHYDLVGGGKDHFVVGMKDCLNEKGELGDSRWRDAERRTWCDTTFRNAVPERLRNCFKQFQYASAISSSEIVTLSGYFSLFAETEVMGTRGAAPQVEVDALTQIQWYAAQANRIKNVNGSAGAWWTRSAPEGGATSYAIRFSGGYHNDRDTYSGNNGISPFGCI